MARVSSALNAVDLKQVPPPLIIGERLNTQGSKRAKNLVLANDIDGLVDLARDQVENGAHCIDVCVATTESSNEKEFMLKLIKRLSLEIEAPLVIDSTDPDIIESSIVQTPGKPIINSINLEGDGSKFARLAPVMAKYGVPAIALCIGPKGMAKTSDEKLETAKLLYETGKKYGLKPEQFIFDVLTFTLGTGEREFVNAGVNTLEGIKKVKAHFPNCYTTLGLSNISFGLTPSTRRIINSVFLHHAIKHGLDSAIVNSKEILPYGQIDPQERKLAEDLIFNSNDNALANIISHFADDTTSTTNHTSTTGSTQAKVDSSWSPGKRVNFRIINRIPDGLQKDVVHAIAHHINKTDSVVSDENNNNNDILPRINEPAEVTHPGAIAVLNEYLLPAMKEVGDKFGAGELILPFVLRSAECMKSAVAELEKYLLKDQGATKGKLVLGTVYGDVHDIGKNLVKTIFENNGYTVYDLGKQVPLQKFLEKIDEVNADAVGLSALLVSTSKEMKLFVEHAKKSGMRIPILCGGAAINTNYINRIAKQQNQIYEHGVFYCNTMFDGLKNMDRLMSDEKPQLLQTWKDKLESWKDPSDLNSSAHNTATTNTLQPKSSISPMSNPPTPSNIDSSIHLDSTQIDIKQVWDLIDKKSLFKLSWGLRGKAGAQQQDAHLKLFEEWKKRVFDDNLFEPYAVYGYYRCRSQGTQLLVQHNNQTFTFDFPRSTKPKRLCLADYFSADHDDIVAFQAVTVGNRVTQTIDSWNAENKYTDAYYLHGLAVEFAEGMAAWVNKRIKDELGAAFGKNASNDKTIAVDATIQQQQQQLGCLRYSWGYPSCPDTLQHRLVWDILSPKPSKMSLISSSGQIEPEQSTAAIVVPHPNAEYFV